MKACVSANISDLFVEAYPDSLMASSSLTLRPLAVSSLLPLCRSSSKAMSAWCPISWATAILILSCWSAPTCHDRLRSPPVPSSSFLTSSDPGPVTSPFRNPLEMEITPLP